MYLKLLFFLLAGASTGGLEAGCARCSSVISCSGEKIYRCRNIYQVGAVVFLNTHGIHTIANRLVGGGLVIKTAVIQPRPFEPTLCSMHPYQEPITQREGALNLCMYADSTCCQIALAQHSLYGKCYVSAIIYLALV